MRDFKEGKYIRWVRYRPQQNFFFTMYICFYQLAALVYNKSLISSVLPGQIALCGI